MLPITFDRQSYRIGNTPAYLLSGEFHYFRVPKEDWRRRMRLFKEAGGNILATYIPWLLHEPEEGNFTWGEVAGSEVAGSGSTDWLDLEGFLQTAREENLYVIARPGPYQYSELIYDGLPGWLCENYPEVLARDRQGEIFRKSSVSYVHPLFWEKVRRWFAVVCPILARYTLSQGGPIAFVQIDNEMTGIHEWFGSLDYNPISMGFFQPEGRYPKFLQERFQDIDRLNAFYGTQYARIEWVEPPETKEGTVCSIRRNKDYFDFYLGTIAEYASFLVSLIRDSGIDTPIVHNSANPGMNAYFLETQTALGSQFLLGSDHYYSLDQNWPQNHPTPQYAARCLISLEELRLMGYPPTVFELPGGSCSDWPPITPTDALACYLANLAFGMKGHNYYIFTGGPNPPGAGANTDLYDYNASIGPDGDIRPLYQAQKAFGELVASHPWLVDAERKSDLFVALDFEYSRSDHYWTGHGEFALSPGEAWELLRKGPLTTALCAGLSPQMVRLDSPIPADTASPLVVVASSSMSAARQQNLVDFLQSGGKALILPILPVVDEDLEPCTILADFLGSPQAVTAPKGFYRPVIGGVVNVLGEITFWENIPAAAQVVGVEEKSGKPVAWKITTPGGGEALVLGLRLSHAMREHARMFTALLGMLGLQPIIQCSNPNIWTTLWVSDEGKAALFLLNLFSAPMEAEVSFTLPGKQTVRAGVHQLGPVSVKIVDFP
jgi:beta-galactosidase